MKTIAILASGTGGHIYPALSIAKKYISQGYKVLWIGTPNGLEDKIVLEPNIIMKKINSQGIRGKTLTKKIISLISFSQSIIQSILIFKKYKPNMVFGFGGFVSVAPSFVGYIMSIPVIIHEQNAIVGTANKINYYFAKRIYETFPLSFNKNNKKIIYTGNPVRESFTKLTNPENKYKNNKSSINIMVMGGSQGSMFLNKTMPFAFSHFYNKNISIKHITGQKDCKTVMSKYSSYQLNADVISYSDDIGSLYEWSDLVVCRAGSTSIAELSIIGRASLLVPFPYATDNHQVLNANYLAKNSSAIMLEESDDFVENFVSIINILLNDSKKLYSLAKNIQNIFPEDTTDKIINDSINYIK
jgi:UDP-N-acetylglucosamine--N-acetylmuramyl-(pentapeptide) pyrophosphoryl-undecaprenol N-acetylglucosamine transferase